MTSARLNMKVRVVMVPEVDGGYSAFVPGFPGCTSCGDTREEALANIREAIELCIEDLQEHGEPIPDPSNVLIGSVVVNQ